MALNLYNTLTKKKEVFKPLNPPKVTIYDCGPTVYSYAHIGNMWRYLVSDLLRRTLEYNGYKVKQVMNITDVGHLTEDDLLAADTGEDKMVVAAKRERKTPAQIASFYTKAFFRDTERLNILRPHVVPKATEHIDEMIKIIRILEQKGVPYWAGDKYFVYDISKFKDYGKLSGKKLEDLRPGVRLESVPGKRNPLDFALWIKDPNHLMKWNSPWGVGYPGWHIECSAMSMKYLGETIDIHTGGEDNIFPHHENEIAQSEMATGKTFVHYWLHVRHNLVEGEKMSKSKGTFFLLQDLMDKGYDPLAYRYLCLNTHYRTNLNFSWQSLEAANKTLQRLRQEVESLKREKGIFSFLSKGSAKSQQYKKEFLNYINDDLNMPKALGLTWEMLKDKELSPKEKYDLLMDFDKVFGLKLDKVKKIKIPLKIKILVRKREKYRKQEDFDRADEIRKRIEQLGYIIEDTDQGPRIKRL
jgi:cysteinyl-tRNA synthetase